MLFGSKVALPVLLRLRSISAVLTDDKMVLGMGGGLGTDHARRSVSVKVGVWVLAKHAERALTDGRPAHTAVRRRWWRGSGVAHGGAEAKLAPSLGRPCLGGTGSQAVYLLHLWVEPACCDACKEGQGRSGSAVGGP
jgi:hypothetical protein